jgi:hypothetical protein
MPESKYHIPRIEGSEIRLLDLVRGKKVVVQVVGDVLVVTMPGTTFSITYEKTEDNRLVATSFGLSCLRSQKLAQNSPVRAAVAARSASRAMT